MLQWSQDVSTELVRSTNQSFKVWVTQFIILTSRHLFSRFSDRHVDIDCQNRAVSWQGNLIGFVDRDSGGAQVDDMMIIRLQNLDGEDVYVNFNRAAGFNIDTDDGFGESEDMVIVTTRKAGLDYEQSWWLAALGQGDTYSAPGLTITVDELSVFTTPMRASITIGHRPQQDQWVCTDAPKFGDFVV